METPFLDQLIEEHQNHIESVEVSSYSGIRETRKQLAELEAIKAITVTHCCETLKDRKYKTFNSWLKGNKIKKVGSSLMYKREKERFYFDDLVNIYLRGKV